MSSSNSRGGIQYFTRASPRCFSDSTSTPTPHSTLPVNHVAALNSLVEALVMAMSTAFSKPPPSKTVATTEARRASDLDDDQVRRHVFRLPLHLCYYSSRMSARILTGGLQAVLPGKLAVRGNLGDRCAVCESCNALFCKVLR